MPVAGVKLNPDDAVCDCSAKVGSGLPVAVTANARATPTVAPSGPGLAPNAGASSVPPSKVWLPKYDTVSWLYWSHSVPSVGKPLAGLAVTPPSTVDLRTSVLFTVVSVPDVQALPGSSPVRPKISTYPAVEDLYSATASSPLKAIAVVVDKSAATLNASPEFSTT